MDSRGILALDIDGTITDRTREVPHIVATYFKELSQKGFIFFFITGRTFSFAKKALKNLSFPYFLGLQNGADLLKMPEKILLGRSYLDRYIVLELDKLYETQKEDFIIYAGYERGDFCYYRPMHFSFDMLDYLETLKKLSPDPWQAIDRFTSIEQREFPLIKCFGEKEILHDFEKILSHLPIHTSTILDPLSGYLNLLLVTGNQATKGLALKHLKEQNHFYGPIIAAGDDNNDMSMLQRADVKIVMQTAPLPLQEVADIIAPASHNYGIISALETVIKKWNF